ncbi:hypothetical protein HOY82DRAFT_419874 [Tuber indicum]|nr:hypothetical protein HOY82DRAFT_419874 [Tuber indicum]
MRLASAGAFFSFPFIRRAVTGILVFRSYGFSERVRMLQVLCLYGNLVLRKKRDSGTGLEQVQPSLFHCAMPLSCLGVEPLGGVSHCLSQLPATTRRRQPFTEWPSDRMTGNSATEVE